MSETSPQPQQPPAKPGTACLGCRRRKLKCSREQEGCNNCMKADLPCVYPAPESGVKRKRGPYKKDKPARERHLEDLVKYLEPKTGQSESAEEVASGAFDRNRDEGHSPSDVSSTGHEAPRGIRLESAAGRKTSNSEDLVKDALIALTRSSVSDRENGVVENAPIISQPTLQVSGTAGNLGLHPPIRQIFEYWHLYVRRVDPLLKIFHCRTFEKTLFKAVENLQNIGPVTESLLFSIYYAAVGSCTDRQARKRFAESREVLLQRYARVIEAALADNYSMPVLESLQALVIYIISIRRDDTTGNIRALFSLAVRMAQMMGLQQDPEDAFSPFEAEYRRRLWWHICGLESRGAEEGGARQSSIMEESHVRLPSNLNDVDLDPNARDPPQSRTGVTEVTFVLLRWESVRMIQTLMEIKKKHKAKGQDAPDVEAFKADQRKALDEATLRIETYYLRHLHESRPHDWLCIGWIELMMIKSRLIIEYPLSQVPTKEMSAAERFDLLQSSVNIIRLSHAVTVNPSIEDWKWYFRGWVQWHCIAIVIAELGGNKNQQFVNTAWAVLDPILEGWDKVYRAKKDEPAWEHVNTLIERARQMRRRVPIPQHSVQPAQSPSHAPPSNMPVSQLAPQDNSVPTSTAGGFWQGEAWSPFNISDTTIIPPFQSPSFNPNQLSAPPTGAMGVLPPMDMPNGCAPTMPGLEGADFGYIDGLDSIDLSAFDAVFGDTAWDFSNSSPSTDLNMEGLENLNSC